MLTAVALDRNAAVALDRNAAVALDRNAVRYTAASNIVPAAGMSGIVIYSSVVLIKPFFTAAAGSPPVARSLGRHQQHSQ